MDKKELIALINTMRISHITLDISQDGETTDWMSINISGAPEAD